MSSYESEARMTRRTARGFVAGALADLRKARGWSLAQLSIASEVSEESLRRWEAGRGIPSINTLRAVLEALRPGESLQLAARLFAVPPQDRHPSDWRALKLLTLDELAELADVSVQVAGRIERGVRWPSDETTAARIAATLSLNLDDLRESYLRARRDAL